MSAVSCGDTAHPHLTAVMGVALTDFVLLMALMKGVLGQSWDITLPDSIVGISKSCITVPCVFTIPVTQETNILNCSKSGLWRKGAPTGPTFINSLKPFTNGQIIGDLTKKNCTAVMENFSEDKNDIFFFRLDCSNLKFTFPKGVRITAQTDPAPPQMTPVTLTSEGTRTNLHCSAPLICYNLPPSISWQPQDTFSQEVEQVVHMVQATDGQMVMTSTLTFTATADLHNQSIVCSVSYPLSKGKSRSATTRRLNVLYGPRFTTATLSTSGPVSVGRFVTFTCTSDANPPVRSYTWFRDDRGRLTRVGQGQTLIFQVSKSDFGVYLCEAQNQRDSQRSGPVILEGSVSAPQENNENTLIIPYIICGVLLVLFILTIAVDLYKHQSLSQRLKKIEQKGEHTYTELRTFNINSDYDQLQKRPQLKPKPAAPEDPEYENSTSKVPV